jgi:hypothetical protein
MNSIPGDTPERRVRVDVLLLHTTLRAALSTAAPVAGKRLLSCVAAVIARAAVCCMGMLAVCQQQQRDSNQELGLKHLCSRQNTDMCAPTDGKNQQVHHAQLFLHTKVLQEHHACEQLTRQTATPCFNCCC